MLVDDDGARIGPVEVTSSEVSDEFARAEGEGFAGHGEWAAAHHRFWRSGGVEVTANDTCGLHPDRRAELTP